MPRILTARTRSSRPRARRTARTSGHAPIEEARAIRACAGSAGARDTAMRRRRVLLRLAAVSACALATTACGGNDEPPTRLLDGSPAVVPTVSLDGVDESAIEATVAVVPRRRIAAGSAEAECLRGPDDAGVGPLVMRVGTYATSVTFRAASGRGLIGCDGVTAAREVGRHWCGRAFGRLRRGRLHDPRLDLACDRTDGGPIAFAWIEPSPRAAYIAVEEHGYVEVCRSSASFAVSEHDRAGHLLRRYRPEPSVAG